MDHSLPGSSVHGILQARILEWVAMPHSWDLPDSGDEPASLLSLHWQAGSLPPGPPGKPIHTQFSADLFVKTDKLDLKFTCKSRDLEYKIAKTIFKKKNRNFPGGPVVKSLCSPCRGPEFNPWLGN